MMSAFLWHQMLNTVNPNDPQENWWDTVVQLASEMTCTCDPTLGSPAATDCEQLLYQGFGAGTLTATLTPGKPIDFTQGTCSLAVSASSNEARLGSMTKAFSSPIDVCVEDPISKPLGGRAFFGDLSQAAIIDDLLILAIPCKRRKARYLEARSIFDNTTVIIVTGLNALPVGANLTLWKNSGNPANLQCEMRMSRQVVRFLNYG